DGPATPVTPAAPGGPAAPLAPLAPGAPAGPAAPPGPVAPDGPAGPRGPVGPVAPPPEPPAVCTCSARNDGLCAWLTRPMPSARYGPNAVGRGVKRYATVAVAVVVAARKRAPTQKLSSKPSSFGCPT